MVAIMFPRLHRSRRKGTFRVDFDVVVAPVVARDGITKSFRAPQVMEYKLNVVLNGVAGCALDFRGRRKIGKALRQVHCAMNQGEARSSLE